MQNQKKLDNFTPPLILVYPGTFYSLNDYVTPDGNKPALGVYLSNDQKTKYIISSQLTVPESVFEQSHGGAKYNTMCHSFVCGKPVQDNPERPFGPETHSVEPTYEFLEKKPSGMKETLVVMIKDRNGYVQDDEYIAFLKPQFDNAISQIKTDPENPRGDFINSFTGKNYIPVIGARTNKPSPYF